MKKREITQVALLLIAFFLCNSCKNELVTIEGARDIPVVYGILSLKDSVTYIRVERAFSDPSRNAFEVAQIADSLYYKDAVVSLVNDKTNRRFLLTQVDGNTEGYPRKDGIFAKAPNILYKIKTSSLGMVANEKWRIEVVRQGNTIVKETTTLVGDYTIQAPINNRPLFFRPEPPSPFSVNIETTDNEQTGRQYEVNLNINMDETLNGITASKKLVWNFGFDDIRNINSGVYELSLSFQQQGKEFYEFLNKNVPVVIGASRTIKNIDIEVLVGGQEFIDFKTRFNSNSGITGSQTILNYTNKGGSLGFVGSRNLIVESGFTISNETLENLKNNALTKNLGFR
jgi:hypothetical protein